MATMLCIAAQASQTPSFPPGKIAVFKAGTRDNLNFPISHRRVAPCFVQVFDPVTNNQSAPLVSVAMSTNANVPGSVWINHHAGSEGGGFPAPPTAGFWCWKATPAISQPDRFQAFHRPDRLRAAL